MGIQYATSEALAVRIIPPSSVEFTHALAETISIAGSGFADPSTGFHGASSLAPGCRPILVGSFQGGDLLAVCLALETPGRSALVYCFWPGGTCDLGFKAATLAARELVREAGQRSITFLQALVDQDDHDRGGILVNAGFRRLTTLCYLRRSAKAAPPARVDTGPIEWMAYAPAHDSLFHDVVEQTYEETKDCNELTGLRSTADFLAEHRAGVGDPSAHWWLAARRGRPIGVLLTAPILDVKSLEIVYLGVAQPARKTGVANALLARAVQIARARNDALLMLGVDERNEPARRLYDRWGFLEAARKDVWIATSFSH